MALPLTPTADGVIVTIKLTPKARSAGIDGIVEEPGPDGLRPLLKLRVTEAPESGKANAAMIALLAKAWRRPKRDFTLIAGETSRLKRVHVAGAPETLLHELSSRLQGEP